MHLCVQGECVSASDRECVYVHILCVIYIIYTSRESSVSARPNHTSNRVVIEVQKTFSGFTNYIK